MKFILIGALAAVAAILAGFYFCFATFFRVNAQYRGAVGQLSPPESAKRERAEVVQQMKAEAGK
jgi:hypothetical protein